METAHGTADRAANLTQSSSILAALLATPPTADKPPEARLRDMLDRQEILELIGRYAHRVAHGKSLVDLFTDDGVFIVRFPGRPIQETRGRQALEEHLGDRPDAADHPLPMIHNHVISISGDEAIGICSNELRMTEDSRSMIGSGYYQDRYRREDGRWKFVLRDMTFIHWVPLQQGWAR